MAANPKVILESIAERITESLLDVFGREHIEAVIISGSLAESKIAFFEEGDSIEIYSDIDLSVILSKCGELDEAREKARLLAAEIGFRTESYRLFRAPDIGIYDRRDLLNQPSRPGTVDMKQNFRVLYGHDEIFKEKLRFNPEEIQITEALYLLENRMIEHAMGEEMLAIESDEGTHRFLYYLCLKLCIDILSAFLILKRNYSPDPEERIDKLLRGNLVIGTEFEDDLREAILYAQERINHLQEAMLGDDYDSFIRKVRGLSLLSWKRIAEACYCIDREAGWMELLKKRCYSESVVTNLRQALVFSKRLHRGFAEGFFSWASGLRMTPINALRLSGLIHILSSLDGGGCDSREAEGWMRSYLDRYTRRMGLAEGSAFYRARRLYKKLA